MTKLSNSLRVIAGTLKGRRLKTPSWEGLRPTSDKLRGTLFNILGPRIRGARVLDGYAGTGALGIEALSRGAAWVTFVDRDRRAQALIAQNLAHCGMENVYAIIPATVGGALDALSERPTGVQLDTGSFNGGSLNGRQFYGGQTNAGQCHAGHFDPGPFDPVLFDPVPFDIVLLDPPYVSQSHDDIVPILSAAGRVLAPTGVLVLERARRSGAPEVAGRLVRARDVVSGNSALAFYDVLAS